MFHSQAAARIVIEPWRQQYNTCRPHSPRGPPSSGTPPLRAGHPSMKQCAST
ncbi:transposase [Rhodobacter sphaeroides]|nr:transposase [Cereibacter sphaeroides]